jgi:hypothetical protein
MSPVTNQWIPSAATFAIQSCSRIMRDRGYCKRILRRSRDIGATMSRRSAVAVVRLPKGLALIPRRLHYGCHGNGARLLHRYDVRHAPRALLVALGAKASQQPHGSEDWQWRISISDSGRVCRKASLGGFPQGACQRRTTETIE